MYILVFSCGRAKTIQIRYVWKLTFSQNGETGKHGNEHCDWFILPLRVPTSTIWFSLNRKRRSYEQNWEKTGTLWFFWPTPKPSPQKAPRLRIRRSWKPMLTGSWGRYVVSVYMCVFFTGKQFSALDYVKITKLPWEKPLLTLNPTRTHFYFQS